MSMTTEESEREVLLLVFLRPQDFRFGFLSGLRSLKIWSVCPPQQTNSISQKSPRTPPFIFVFLSQQPRGRSQDRIDSTSIKHVRNFNFLCCLVSVVFCINGTEKKESKSLQQIHKKNTPWSFHLELPLFLPLVPLPLLQAAATHVLLFLAVFPALPPKQPTHSPRVRKSLPRPKR